MRSNDPSHLVEWIVISLRWLFLLGVAIWLALSEEQSGAVILILVLSAAFNLLFTALAATNRTSTASRWASVGVDAAMAYSIFFYGGSMYGNPGWVGVMPVISCALFFRLPGALIAILLNIIVQSAIALNSVPLSEALLFIGMLVPLYIAAGLVFAYIGRRLSKPKTKTQAPKPEPRPKPSKPRMSRSEYERQRAIYELISALSASLNYERIIETVLDLSTDALYELNAPVNQMISAVLLFEEIEDLGTRLKVGTYRRMLSTDVEVYLPGTQGVIGRAIDGGDPNLTKNLAEDTELSQFESLEVCRAAYCLPLRTGLDAYGILLFAHPDPEFFTPERREVLVIVAKQLVVAIQNARLYQDLEQEKERMMEIQEDARKKMARDLHDGPTQSVSAIAMRVNFARRLLERDPNTAAEELYKIEELARRTTKEIRLMLFTLRPLVLESQGLVAALESMAEKMAETHNQNVIIEADEHVAEELEAGKQAVVFYIAEEAVSNARKHAEAKHVWVRLKALQSDLSLLEIEDDGVGFDVNSVNMSYDNRGSLGMLNMRERTDLISGLFRIDSVEGRGTLIQVAIPLTEEAADRIQHRM